MRRSIEIEFGIDLDAWIRVKRGSNFALNKLGLDAEGVF